MDLDKREHYYTKFREANFNGFTPDDYLEYYAYIKERFGVDIDFFEDAPDTLVYDPITSLTRVDQVEAVKMHLKDAKFNFGVAIEQKNEEDITECSDIISDLEKTAQNFEEEDRRWAGRKFPLPDLRPGDLDTILRDKVPEHLCLFPFTQMNIDPDGRARPCCKWEVGNVWDYNNGSLEDKNIQELFDQPYIEDIKKQFLRGEKPKACKACWDEEDSGLESIRYMYQMGGKQRPTATWFEHITAPTPVGLDLKLSSICNNKCRICSPFLSSKWLQEHEDLGLVSGGVLKGYRLNAKEKFMTNPENVEILKHWAPRIQGIDFFGGEPLLQAEHNLILKTIAETGKAKDITLYYNTNGAVYDEEICKHWESFGHVNLNYSVDDIGKRFNYERHPAKYDAVMDNVRKYYDYVFTDKEVMDKIITNKKYFHRFNSTRHGEYPSPEIMKQRGMKIAMINRFYITVGFFNIFYIDEILQDLTTKFNMELQFNPVHFPHHYACHILPEKMKKVIIEKLNKIKFRKIMDNKYIKCAPGGSTVNKEIDHLITFMNSSKENPQLIKYALKTIKLHDDYRKESFEEVFPEMWEFLKEYE
jgi:MoaA/NifB/PqqE/SkfB family radical SAM enzyme